MHITALRNTVALLACSASHCSLFLHLSTSLLPPPAALRRFALCKRSPMGGNDLEINNKIIFTFVGDGLCAVPKKTDFSNPRRDEGIPPTLLQ